MPLGMLRKSSLKANALLEFKLTGNLKEVKERLIVVSPRFWNVETARCALVDSLGVEHFFCCTRL